jgi:hypothetical protein
MIGAVAVPNGRSEYVELHRLSGRFAMIASPPVHTPLLCFGDIVEGHEAGDIFIVRTVERPSRGWEALSMQADVSSPSFRADVAAVERAGAIAAWDKDDGSIGLAFRKKDEGAVHAAIKALDGRWLPRE